MGYDYKKISETLLDMEISISLDGESSEEEKAVRAAILAVEKMIAKKPQKNCQLFLCPSCDRRVGRRSKYCKECGQHIDWNI